MKALLAAAALLCISEMATAKPQYGTGFMLTNPEWTERFIAAKWVDGKSTRSITFHDNSGMRVSIYCSDYKNPKEIQCTFIMTIHGTEGVTHGEAIYSGHANYYGDDAQTIVDSDWRKIEDKNGAVSYYFEPDWVQKRESPHIVRITELDVRISCNAFPDGQRTCSLGYGSKR